MAPAVGAPTQLAKKSKETVVSRDLVKGNKSMMELFVMGWIRPYPGIGNIVKYCGAAFPNLTLVRGASYGTNCRVCAFVHFVSYYATRGACLLQDGEEREKNVLTYKRTSLLEANTQTLVNTVNCVGVMGKGLAKAFKQREPKMFKAYKRICDQKLLEPGKLWLWRGSEQWVLNFPTKLHWRSPSRMEWVEAGLDKFVNTYEEQGVTEIAFPKLGCGNGDLDWEEVKPLMARYLADLSIPVFIHDFTKDIGLPEHLEHLAEEVRKSISDLSFQSFVSALENISKLAPKLRLDDKHEFEISFDSDTLEIQAGENVWCFEEDDLRGFG